MNLASRPPLRRRDPIAAADWDFVLNVAHDAETFPCPSSLAREAAEAGDHGMARLLRQASRLRREGSV